MQRPLLAAEPKTLSPEEAAETLRKLYTQRWIGLIMHHLLFVFVAPMFFSWRNLMIAEAIRFVTSNIGIGLCYHRLLTHHSFR
jgi:stearoyl-CoA desaturase (delta-9 desaturase)